MIGRIRKDKFDPEQRKFTNKHKINQRTGYKKNYNNLTPLRFLAIQKLHSHIAIPSLSTTDSINPIQVSSIPVPLQTHKKTASSSSPCTVGRSEMEKPHFIPLIQSCGGSSQSNSEDILDWVNSSAGRGAGVGNDDAVTGHSRSGDYPSWHCSLLPVGRFSSQNYADDGTVMTGFSGATMDWRIVSFFFLLFILLWIAMLSRNGFCNPRRDGTNLLCLCT